jgi:hypothetical protein
MRPYRVLLRGQGVFFAAQSSADCITSMAGFDLRQAQARGCDTGGAMKFQTEQVDEIDIRMCRSATTDRRGVRKFPREITSVTGGAATEIETQQSTRKRTPVLESPSFMAIDDYEQLLSREVSGPASSSYRS